MKSARDRACVAADIAGVYPSSPRYLAVVDLLEISFKEHAREALDAAAQRLMVAVRGSGDAPAPGEER